MKISIGWKDLELDEAGNYNESFLADIRKQLRARPPAEAAELELQLDGESAPPWLREKLPGFAGDAALQDRYLEAAAHCARRLKNCDIAKWALFCPAGVSEAFFRRLKERLPLFTLRPGGTII
jgi:hypothetical protein